MVYLRKATLDDIDLLYRWANDPAVRKNSFNTEPISYDNHLKWFNNIMSDPSVLQYILMDDDTPVGQIRLNVEGEKAELGYSVDSLFRGKKYGKRLLQLIAKEINKNYPEISTLVAKVKPENIASKKMLESEGFEMKYSCYSLKNTGGGYYELKNFLRAIPNAELCKRRIA